MQQSAETKSSEQFRAFIAADIPDELREIINKIVAKLKQDTVILRSKCRWVNPKNLHITLRFLGNITLEQADTLTANITKNIISIKPFILNFTKLITFPQRRPRMLVLDIEPLDELIRLGTLLDAEALKCNVRKEQHPFNPHLTLVRIENLHGRIDLPKKLPPLQFMLDKIILYRSEPTSEGSVYPPVREINLTG